MPETSAFLADRLKTEGEKTIAFFETLSPEQWQSDVYTEAETWAVRNVLAHYVTAEKGFLTVFSGIRGGGPGVRDDFDIDRYNASQQRKTMQLSPADLLAEFSAVRQDIGNRSVKT